MARPPTNLTVDLTRTYELTAGLISRLNCPSNKKQVFLRDSKSNGLKVRATIGGSKSFVFESKIEGRTFRITIGDVKSWTINQAREHSNQLRVTIDRGKDPRILKLNELREIEKVRQQKEIAENFTFKNLLNDYCEHLQKLGRRSHLDARSIFHLHIFDKWPKLAALPANQITTEQIADVMRKLIEVGKGRTSNKLRSYVRAAYQMAKASKSKASLPVKFKSYEVSSNPAADTEPDESQNKPDKDPLTIREIQTYWSCIKKIEGLKGAVLRLHLLTGGQRIEQLVKLLTVNTDSEKIVLFDGKGRPGKPARPHSIPLIYEAQNAIRSCNSKGKYTLSTDEGLTHISAVTLSKWAKNSNHEIKNFKAKRIRSGIETLLAKSNIPSEIRGRLQSHGVSGVQARHYDGYDYILEKTKALEILFEVLKKNKEDL